MVQLLKKPLMIFLGTFILMALSERMGVRVDFTSDQRYTLTPTTIRYLKELKEPLLIDVFLAGELPGLYRGFRNEVEVFLNQLSYYTEELIIQYNDPYELGSTEQVVQEMQRYGMIPEIVVDNK